MKKKVKRLLTATIGMAAILTVSDFDINRDNISEKPLLPAAMALSSSGITTDSTCANPIMNGGSCNDEKYQPGEMLPPPVIMPPPPSEYGDEDSDEDVNEPTISEPRPWNPPTDDDDGDGDGDGNKPTISEPKPWNPQNNSADALNTGSVKATPLTESTKLPALNGDLKRLKLNKGGADILVPSELNK